MSTSFNYQDMPMSVWADTLEDQGIDTTDLRAWIDTGCFCPYGYGYSYAYGDGYSYEYAYVNGNGGGYVDERHEDRSGDEYDY